MAVVETAKGRTAYIKVDNGRTASGSVITSNVSLGTMSVANWDSQKAMNIVLAYTALLSNDVVDVQTTLTSSLETGD